MRRDRKIECEEYLEYVRQQRPVVPGKIAIIDPHHFVAAGNGSAKKNDFTAIPMTRDKHSELEQVGVEKFQREHNDVDLWQEAFYQLLEFSLPRLETAGVEIKYGKI